MNHPAQVLETVTRVTPLGVRFWDPVAEAAAEGLGVTAYRAGDSRQRVTAVMNRKGVYLLRDVPGLGDLESGAGDAAYWASLPPPQRFTVEVVDPAGRFIPFSFTADLPCRGLFTWQCATASPPNPPAAFVPLFSTASRPVPAGSAAVRADLWDPGAGAPAAGAVLEVRPAGQPAARGIADDQGRVVVLLPWPPPALPFPVLGSPMAGAAVPLAQQQWPVDLRASYAPLGPGPPPRDLCALLSQPPADLWSGSSRLAPLTGATLRFGQDLVLRTLDEDRQVPLSVLYITPAASPL
jgi:hypothetical protein